MTIVLAIVVGALFTGGVYMMLRRSLVKLLIGLALLGHGANLLIFSAAGLVRGNPPVIEAGATVLVSPHDDPIPQALILTAIVIGFGVMAFALTLSYSAYKAVETDDLDKMKTTDTLVT